MSETDERDWKEDENRQASTDIVAIIHASGNESQNQNGDNRYERNGKGMGHMVSRVDGIRDQKDNEYIYTNGVSILKNIRNVELSKLFLKAELYSRLTCESFPLALPPNTIPIISQRNTDPAVSDCLIFQEKLEIELLCDTFHF